MKLHMRNAHKLGITHAQMKEVILKVMYYAKQAKGFYAMRRLKEVMEEARGRPAGVRRTMKRRKTAGGQVIPPRRFAMAAPKIGDAIECLKGKRS